MTYWRRNTNVSPLAMYGSYWNDAISPGNTYLRVRIRWGFHADTPLNVSLVNVASNLVTFGLVTTYGNGTETAPDPLLASYNLNPPTNRWIYWETLSPSVQAISHDDGVIVWGNSASTEPTQTRGEVLATGVPPGDTLNLWASWACPFEWSDFDGNAMIWHSIEILRKNNGL